MDNSKKDIQLVSEAERLRSASSDESVSLVSAVAKDTNSPAPQSKTEQAVSTRNKKDPFIGTELGGRYNVESLLGRGATTTVYKAHDKEKNREVAIKILRMDSIFNEQTINRFEQECKTLGLLKHANIVSLLDNGITDSDQPYIVMECVEGTSLQHLIEINGALDIKRTLAIFEQICAALTAAHEKGIVHRDMKPANIMITTNAQGKDLVKILDFGVAKFLVQGETFQTKTQTGEMLGTLLYMSPEQCLDQVLDGRCDVYSLGCVLYETLTGKPPLVGRTAFETMNKHLAQMPEKLVKARPDLMFPPRLEQVVATALAKDPNNRYQTIGAMQNAIEKLLNDPKLMDASIGALVEPKPPAETEQNNQPLKTSSAVSKPEVIAVKTGKTEQIIDPLDIAKVIPLVLVACVVIPSPSNLIFLIALGGLICAFFATLAGNAFSSAPDDTSIEKTDDSNESVEVTAAANASTAAEIPYGYLAGLPERANVIYFLAMESLDGVNWRQIYSDKIIAYAISYDDVETERQKLLSAHTNTLEGIKEFTIKAFDSLDLNQDGEISREEIIAALKQPHLRFREKTSLSFLLDHMPKAGDHHANSANGISKSELENHFQNWSAEARIINSP